MFESNFPMDRGSCGFTTLLNAYKLIVEKRGMSQQDQGMFFAGTCARIYDLRGLGHFDEKPASAPEPAPDAAAARRGEEKESDASASAMTTSGRETKDVLWKIVGGADKGGIIVRTGELLTTSAEKERLTTGSKVSELKLVGDRLNYNLVEGSGPRTGWISVRLAGRVLAEKE